MMKSIVKLGLVLAIFAAAACVALAGVYALTAERIDNQAALQLDASFKDIFPDMVSQEDITASISSGDPSVSIKHAWLVKGPQDVLGVAIKAGTSSYGGEAVLLVGVRPDRHIAGVRILELKDTPGLGANAASPNYFVDKEKKLTFPAQFAGKGLADGFEVKKDIVAVSASTITSKALTKIVKTAGASAAAWLETAMPAAAAPDTGDAASEAAAGTAQAAPAASASTGGK